MHHYISKIAVLLLICLFLAGCQNDLTKSVEKTDQTVYQLIDNGWKDGQVAEDANYMISENNICLDESIIQDISQKNELSLADVVAIASKYSREYATEREKLYLTALNHADIKHFYETELFSDIRSGQVKNGPDEAAGGTSNTGFSKLLATGARIGSNVSIGWLDILSGDLKSGLSTVVSAVITQPILRGAGRKVALENLTQAQRNTLYQIRDFNRFRKVYITFIINSYYEALILQKRLSNAQEYHDILVNTFTKLEKRSKVGKVSKHQFEQINQDILDAKSICTQRKQEYIDALDRLKLAISVPLETNITLDQNELDALILSINQENVFQEQRAIDIALDQRLDLINANDKVEDALRKVDVAADAIRAELNLIGYVQSNGNRAGRGAFGANPGELSETQKQFDLSLQLKLPLDRVSEKYAYRRSLITLEAQQRYHQELTDIVISEIRSAHRRMQIAGQRYQFDKESCTVAEKRSKNAMLLLQYDRASTRDLLDSYDDLFDSRDAAAESLINYISASLDLYRDTGVIKVLPDGKWENRLPATADSENDGPVALN